MKLFLVLAAVSSLVIAAANATYLEDEASNRAMKSKCMRQMRMMEPQLDSCEDYMTMDEQQMDMRRMRGQECRSMEECMRGCCRAMKEMDEECMCMWMKNMVDRQQRGEMGEEDMRMMMRKMKMMPSKCGMGHMSCPMGTRYDQ